MSPNLNLRPGSGPTEDPLENSRIIGLRQLAVAEQAYNGPSYPRGATVTVSFVTGHPKNNLHRNGTFLEVQKLNGGQWQRVADDGDWDTTYRWERTGLADSKAVITWKAAGPGTYRIVHHGDSLALNGTMTPFTGSPRTFSVN